MVFYTQSSKIQTKWKTNKNHHHFQTRRLQYEDGVETDLVGVPVKKLVYTFKVGFFLRERGREGEGEHGERGRGRYREKK